MTIFKYALIRGLKNPLALTLNCGLPILLLVFAEQIFDDGLYIGSDARGFYFIAFTIMWGSFLIAQGIRQDKLEGVIVRILAGPVVLRSYLTQNFLAAMVPMAVISVIIGALGMAVHGWTMAFALGLALCYALLAATSIGLSFAFSCLFKNKDAVAAVFGAMLTLVAFICGLMIPLAGMPTPLFYLGTLFPAHWAARAIEALHLYGISGMYWIGMLAMLMFTVAYILYGSKRGIM